MDQEVSATSEQWPVCFGHQGLTLGHRGRTRFDIASEIDNAYSTQKSTCASSRLEYPSAFLPVKPAGSLRSTLCVAPIRQPRWKEVATAGDISGRGTYFRVRFGSNGMR